MPPGPFQRDVDDAVKASTSGNGASANGNGSGGGGSPMWDGSFEVLIEQARSAHDLEVRRLQHEVVALRRELDSTNSKQVSHPDAPRGERPAPLQATRAPFDDDDEPKMDCVVAPARQASSSAPLSPPVPAREGEDARRTSRMSASSKEAGVVSKGSLGLDGSMKKKRTMERLARQRGCLWAIVTRPAFEVAVAAVIAFNGVVIALEAQYAGFNLAEDTGHPSAHGRADEVWPGAAEVFHALNPVFGVVFLVEVMIKMLGLRWDFVKDLWNMTDLVVALVWVVTESTSTQINAQFVRLARLVRLIRLIRLAKFVQNWGMDSLFLLSTALKGSIGTVGWAFAVLLSIHVILAIFLNSVLRETYFDSASKSAAHVEVYAYFGSFSRSFLTSFEITLANWPTPVRVLVDNVSEIFILYAVLHKTVFGFAVVGVINAVFIQETFKAAQADDSLMVRQTLSRERTHCEKMTHLFNEADDNHDGTISVEEWHAVCQDEWVQLWLRSQEIKVKDAMSLFEWLDNGDGQLTAKELVEGTAALKGPSAVMSILHKLQQLDNSMKVMRAELLVDAAVARERV